MAETEPLAGPGFDESERDLVRRVVTQAETFEKGIGRDFKERCERFYRQYRGFRQFADAWTRGVSPNDRDAFIYDAKRTWGAHLHIPLSFRTIETIVPKAIANQPRILIEPRKEQWRENAEAIRLLLDRQQDQINIDLALQMVMRSGQMYGLGVGKDYWRREVISRRRVVPRTFKRGYKLQTDKAMRPETTFDDPMFEDVDVFDFFWDPYGSDMRTCEWVIHRVWMSTEAVVARVKEGAWRTKSAEALDEDAIRRLGSAQLYGDVWRDRLEVSGFASMNFDTAGEQPHELLEWHDGEQVFTVLDRQVLVQQAESPCRGMMPFQIYRPTPLPKQLVGIGNLEPIEHLQRELDTLRSQRRDAATIALCAGFIFNDERLSAEDLVFGPNAAIPVEGDPREAIQQIIAKDVPGSGYQEEAAILRDIESVSGGNDALEPNQGAQTATEAQLVQASLSRRIELGSRRFEREVVKPCGQAWLYLNQRMILENRPAIRVPEEGVDELEAINTGAYKEYPIGPGELMGEYEFKVMGGSLAARNTPQDRSDALQLMQLFGQHPDVNPHKVLEKALELFGVKHPRSWMRSPEPAVPVRAIEILQAAGVPEELLRAAVQRAQQQEAPADEGPSPAAVASMMSPNGGAPNA